MEENKKNDLILYRVSQHPSVAYTSLEKAKNAAREVLESFMADMDDVDINDEIAHVFFEDIAEWDGTGQLEFSMPTDYVDSNDLDAVCFVHRLTVI